MISSISKGNQTKYWMDGYLIKLDSPGWYESISEVLVSELQGCIVNALPYVDYEYMVYKGVSACRSKNFLHSGESVISLKKALDLTELNIDYTDSGQWFKDCIVGSINIKYGLYIEDYLAYMVYLDAIVLNEDRHLRNISFVKMLDGRLRLSPLYDFGLSLLSDTDRYVSEDCRNVKSQPFEVNFEEQVKLFDNPHITIDLDKLMVKLLDVRLNPEYYVNKEKVGDLLRGINVLISRLEETEDRLWYRKRRV